MSKVTDAVLDAAVGLVLNPLVEKAKDFGQPILAFIPDELEEKAEDKFKKFIADLLREGLALLNEQGKLVLTTTGSVTIEHHTGKFPGD